MVAARPGRHVRVEQAADVGVRDEVAVHQQQRLRRRLGQQAERAGRAEGLFLAEVVDPRAELGPVPEVLLDQVAEVVDRDRDPVDPGARRGAARSAPGSGGPATRSIGLGTVSVSGRRRTPCPPAMTTARVRPLDRLKERVQQVEAHRAPVVVHDRDGVDPAGAHQLEDVGAVLARSDRDERPREDRADGGIRGRRRQGAPGAGRRR